MPDTLDMSNMPDTQGTHGKGLQHFANLAMLQVQRMRVLVDDLLDAGRLQTGKLNLKREPVDLGALVRETVEAVQLAHPERPLAVEVPAVSLQVAGDAARLAQVLVNLLTNAIEHAPHAKRIEVRLRQTEGVAELQVQDDGPGIAAAEVPHIFTRFHQVARPGGETMSGLGLGLYITKEVVTALGGTIAVEAHEGTGTLFTVQLPVLDGVADTAGPHREGAAGAR